MKKYMGTENIKKIVSILKENDYSDIIEVMNYDDAVEFLNEMNEANGCEESVEDFFGEELTEDSIVLYALPNNGDGRAFVYTPAPYQHFYLTAMDAFSHAYGEELNIPKEYRD